MANKRICRRQFINTSIKSCAFLSGISMGLVNTGCEKQVNDFSNAEYEVDDAAVSIVKIKKNNVKDAVSEAIHLLGGIETLTLNKEKIMLKPNLVCDSEHCTTKPIVIKTLIELLQKAGKEVSLSEGSAAASGYNNLNGKDYQTSNQQILNNMQKYIFNKVGYNELANNMGVPLINLHTGDMAEHTVDNAHAFEKLQLHHSISDIDMLISVPMMKTHTLGMVTLGLKNLLGLYPGSVYSSVRWKIHDLAFNLGSKGVAWEILDIAKVSKLGLTVIDGSYAMEGDGPVLGSDFKMDVIIAGTNPFATDMVASKVMGFNTGVIPTFSNCNIDINEIEIRGETINAVKRDFKKPTIYKWNEIRNHWGNEILE